jgi:hypothetical protein
MSELLIKSARIAPSLLFSSLPTSYRLQPSSFIMKHFNHFARNLFREKVLCTTFLWSSMSSSGAAATVALGFRHRLLVLGV